MDTVGGHSAMDTVDVDTVVEFMQWMQWML